MREYIDHYPSDRGPDGLNDRMYWDDEKKARAPINFVYYATCK